jgi:hypothetical protein
MIHKDRKVVLIFSAGETPERVRGVRDGQAISSVDFPEEAS